MTALRMLCAVAVVVLLAACGATTGTNARSSTSAFDGSRTVYIEPHGTDCGMSMVCSSLGAQWNSKAPSQAVLVIETMGAYQSIDSASLNIDGHITHLDRSSGLTHFSQSVQQSAGTYSSAIAELGRTSTQAFHGSLDLIRQMLGAHDVRLRVVTSEMTIDSVVFAAHKDSKSHHALERFMVRVNAALKPTDGR